MKKHLYISLAVITIIVIIPIITYAYGNFFGGQIVSTTGVGISCDGVQMGPLYIRPSTGPMGPYVSVSNARQATVGGWILGSYNISQGPCHTDTDPPVPVTTYILENFNTSR